MHLSFGTNMFIQGIGLALNGMLKIYNFNFLVISFNILDSDHIKHLDYAQPTIMFNIIEQF